ncbi:MAG: hypothetical protein KGN02_00920 [bacterium]|nr:hypothetical protein [bacterium]
MSLVAASRHEYAFAPNETPFVASVLRRYAPAALPTSTYQGSWQPPAFDVANHVVAYVLHAQTRFLSADVEVNGNVFSFRTFGKTLHVADGGGLVEHLLEDDRRELVNTVSQRLGTIVRNPLGWIATLLRVQRTAVASKINVTLLERAHGNRHSEHIAHSVTAEYQRDVVQSLDRGFRRIQSLFSASFWILAYALVVMALALDAQKLLAMRASAHTLHLAVLDAPYTIGILAAGIVAFTYLVSRIGPILPFADRNGLTGLRCLSLVRGGVRAKTLLSVTFLALALAGAFIAHAAIALLNVR